MNRYSVVKHCRLLLPPIVVINKCIFILLVWSSSQGSIDRPLRKASSSYLLSSPPRWSSRPIALNLSLITKSSIKLQKYVEMDVTGSSYRSALSAVGAQLVQSSRDRRQKRLQLWTRVFSHTYTRVIQKLCQRIGL